MRELVLTTTTSAYDSGLLIHLSQKFEARYNYHVNVISVGSGLALELAKQGKSDVVLVHDSRNEQQFIDEGFGVNRRLVMHNDFILVGPLEDPANISDCVTITEAFQKLAEAKVIFISRDDASGTATREKLIWEAAKIDRTTINIQSTKSGMAESLIIASSKGGYLLTDRATYLAKKPELKLKVIFEGDELLLNVYHVIQVSPDKFPHVNAEGARTFINFLLGEGQEIIANFMENKQENPPFIPDGGRDVNEVIKTQEQLAFIY